MVICSAVTVGIVMLLRDFEPYGIILGAGLAQAV
jgi:hypothetical protein